MTQRNVVTASNGAEYKRVSVHFEVYKQLTDACYSANRNVSREIVEAFKLHAQRLNNRAGE